MITYDQTLHLGHHTRATISHWLGLKSHVGHGGYRVWLGCSWVHIRVLDRRREGGGCWGRSIGWSWWWESVRGCRVFDRGGSGSMVVFMVAVVVVVVLVALLVEEFGEDSCRQEELYAVVAAVVASRHHSRDEDVHGQDAEGHQENEEVLGVHLWNGFWKRNKCILCLFQYLLQIKTALLKAVSLKLSMYGQFIILKWSLVTTVSTIKCYNNGRYSGFSYSYLSSSHLSLKKLPKMPF